MSAPASLLSLVALCDELGPNAKSKQAKQATRDVHISRATLKKNESH